MSILDITSENFNIQVKDVAKKIEVNAYHSYNGDRRRMPVGSQTKHNKNALHVMTIVSNRLERAVGKIIPHKPTSRQVRDVVEKVLGKKVSCRIQKYTGKDLKNMVSYHIDERGGQVGRGAIYIDNYKGTEASIRFYEINIRY